MALKLAQVVLDGKRPLRQFALRANEKLCVGRGRRCGVRLVEPSVSLLHAYVLNGVLYDNNSTNGVFVNDKRVESHRLCEGDRILIGETRFVVAAADSNSPRARGALAASAQGSATHLAAAARTVGPDLVFLDRAGRQVARVTVGEGAVLRVGRQPDCDVALNDASVCDLHAIVNGGVIYDSSAGAGTLQLHGEHVLEHRLALGDVLRLGAFFVFVCEPLEPAASAASGAAGATSVAAAAPPSGAQAAAATAAAAASWDDVEEEGGAGEGAAAPAATPRSAHGSAPPSTHASPPTPPRAAARAPLAAAPTLRKRSAPAAPATDPLDAVIAATEADEAENRARAAGAAPAPARQDAPPHKRARSDEKLTRVRSPILDRPLL